MEKKKVHLIAIGGAVMHNLALALQDAGYDVYGSDDIIYDPSKSRLQFAGLLPTEYGWDENRITKDLDFVVVGKHAREDNPELLKAISLDLKIYSFPSFIGEHSKDKKRIVVAGSHGKTTTTSMIMHCLKEAQIDHDYLVGAQLEGYQNMVKLSGAPLIIIEGDEYLTSPLDDRPKFLHYTPHISVITGIAWDHVNVFPSFENYKEQFVKFTHAHAPEGIIYFDGNDKNLVSIAKENEGPRMIPYFPFEWENDKLFHENEKHPIRVFGDHNMSNLKAAYFVCKELHVTDEQFFTSMLSFKGAAKRQQLIVNKPNFKLYLDFAHAPSKVRATVKAFRKKFPSKSFSVIVELHTYSSLTKTFLPEYKDSLSEADQMAIFFNPKNLEIKEMPPLEEQLIKEAFGSEALEVLESPTELESYLSKIAASDTEVLLCMTSGQLGGVNLTSIFT